MAIDGPYTKISPYFDLSLDPTAFDTVDLLATRAHFECRLINLNDGSAYPDVAKQQSLHMLQLTEKMYDDQQAKDTNDRGRLTTPFWGSLPSGERVFHIVSEPMFEPSKYAEHIHGFHDEKRTMASLTDPGDRYGPIVGHDLALNPPRIYDRFGKLLYPNQYDVVPSDGALVYVTSYLNLRTSAGTREYEHVLIQADVLPEDFLSERHVHI